jgi:acyl carrier protein
VPVDEDFPALGGDSLTAISLLSMVEDNFSAVFLPLDTIRFMAAAIASEIDGRGNDATRIR